MKYYINLLFISLLIISLLQLYLTNIVVKYKVYELYYVWKPVISEKISLELF